MQSDRLQEKSILLVKLGALFGPIRRLYEKPEEYNGQEKSQTIARFCAENQTLIAEFHAFSIAQPGHSYEIEYRKFHNAVSGLTGDLLHESEGIINNADMLEKVNQKLLQAQEAISVIPTFRDSAILEANTPFTTFCTLRDLCEVEVSSELTWIDAFFAADNFHRYIRAVRSNVLITLVTSEPNANAGRKDKQRWADFLNISRLYAQERKAHYQLAVHQPGVLHDRWLLIDGKKLYSFGGSAKDAGNRQYFTIASVDPSPQNLQKIQSHVSSGTEYFGPTVGQHL